jgi:MoaA/NifB/PqqE/SkfB family radical SAM enzyme
MRGVVHTVCVLAWHQLQIQPDGRAKICCYDTGGDESVYRQRIDEIWGSERLRGIRLAMARGERPPACAFCHDSEDRTGASMRTLVNRAVDAEGVRRLLARAEAPDPPRQLVLETGNVCNLKCRMCNARSSSAIAADRVHHAWSVAEAEPPPEEPRFPAPWHRQEGFLGGELFSEDIKQLQIVGGETFMSAGGLLSLRTLVASGAAARLDVVLNTNGTWIDEDWLALLGEFRSSTLAVSLEGVGAWNDYIRYPSRFADVLAAIPRLRAVPRAHVMVSSTFQAYNALHYPRLLELCDELELMVYAHPVVNPPHLAARVLPPAARRAAAARLREYFARRTSGLPQVAVEALIPTLEDAGRPWDRELALTFMEFTNDLDATRDQSLAALEPELIGFFAEAGLPWQDRSRHFRADRPTSRGRGSRRG